MAKKIKIDPNLNVPNTPELRRHVMAAGSGDSDAVKSLLSFIQKNQVTSTNSTNKQQGIRESGKKRKVKFVGLLLAIILTAVVVFGGYLTVKAIKGKHISNGKAGIEAVAGDNNSGAKTPGTPNPEKNISGGNGSSTNSGDNESDIPKLFSSAPVIGTIYNPSERIVNNDSGDQIVVNDKNEIVSVNGFNFKDGKVQVSETMAGVVGDESEINELASDAQALYDELVRKIQEQNESNGAPDSQDECEQGLN